jgi:MFS family permease
MPQMFEQAGITNPSTQLLLTAINPIFSMLAAIYGATLLDKLGRRKMLLGGLAVGLFAYVLLTAFTAESENHPDLGYGVIVAIYVSSSSHYCIIDWLGVTPCSSPPPSLLASFSVHTNCVDLRYRLCLGLDAAPDLVRC